jgi:hypothetical protein
MTEVSGTPDTNLKDFLQSLLKNNGIPLEVSHEAPALLMKRKDKDTEGVSQLG